VEEPVLTDKAVEPDDEVLAGVLGRSKAAWDALRARLAEEYPPLTETWKSFGKKSGWTFQLRQKKRTVLWMTPRSKHFVAATSYGDKALAAARESDLPAALIGEIEGARKYAEGRPVRIEVRTKADAAVVERIVAIRMGT
jgi:hypothetical protein